MTRLIGLIAWTIGVLILLEAAERIGGSNGELLAVGCTLAFAGHGLFLKSYPSSKAEE